MGKHQYNIVIIFLFQQAGAKMIFTSIDFFIFFCIVLIIYWLVKQKTLQNIILLIASYLFCSWVHPWFGGLLAGSTVTDFLLGRAMVRFARKRKLWLVISLSINLGLLGVFKYFHFFTSNIAGLLNTMQFHIEPVVLNILLPAGISFYTLRKLGYILDVYHNVVLPADNILEYALYVSFFPQLVAGPIDSYRKLLPQIQSPREWSWKFFYAAWPLFIMGLFKKIVIADNVSLIADKIYALHEPGKFLLSVGTMAFTLQILADFSAYTDLARGIAYMLGFETSENFRSPYLSKSPTEFWNRWHITLSNWLRDYIFFPLRRSLIRRFGNTAPALTLVIPPIVTMFMSGLWHGAGWTYIVWGLYYGLLIVVYQWLGLGGMWVPSGRIKALLAWVIMFALVVFGWSIFRASSLGWLTNILFHAPLLAAKEDWIAGLEGLSLTAAFAMPLFLKLILDKFFWKIEWVTGLYLAVITILLIIYTNTATPNFIYVQF